MENPAQLSRVVYESEAYQIYLRLESLTTSYFVFDRNYEEFNQLLNTVHDPTISAKLWTPDNNQDIAAVLKELTRLLHNLIASAKTLVDHTRGLITEHYPGTDFFSEYEAEIDRRFLNNPRVGFIEDLRNYTLHFRLPALIAHFEIQRDPSTNQLSERQTLILKKDDLLKWTRWTRKGRAYLDGASNRIDLQEVVDHYFDDVSSFHRWMRLRLGNMHAKQLEWLRDMGRKVEAALKTRP